MNRYIDRVAHQYYNTGHLPYACWQAMTQTILLGDYEVSYAPADQPALIMHHLIRGYDAVRLDAAAARELGLLLRVNQKRIRELGGYQVICGAAGDLTIYGPGGQRACYVNSAQTSILAQLLEV